MRYFLALVAALILNATANLLMSFTLRARCMRRADYPASIFRQLGQKRGKSGPVAGWEGPIRYDKLWRAASSPLR